MYSSRYLRARTNHDDPMRVLEVTLDVAGVARVDELVRHPLGSVQRIRGRAVFAD